MSDDRFMEALDAMPSFKVAICPLCDDEPALTKADVVEHLMEKHSPVSLAVYVALVLFVEPEFEAQGSEDEG